MLDGIPSPRPEPTASAEAETLRERSSSSRRKIEQPESSPRLVQASSHASSGSSTPARVVSTDSHGQPGRSNAASLEPLRFTSPIQLVAVTRSSSACRRPRQPLSTATPRASRLLAAALSSPHNRDDQDNAAAAERKCSALANEQHAVSNPQTLTVSLINAAVFKHSELCLREMIEVVDDDLQDDSRHTGYDSSAAELGPPPPSPASRLTKSSEDLHGRQRQRRRPASRVRSPQKRSPVKSHRPDLLAAAWAQTTYSAPTAASSGGRTKRRQGRAKRREHRRERASAESLGVSGRDSGLQEEWQRDERCSMYGNDGAERPKGSSSPKRGGGGSRQTVRQQGWFYAGGSPRELLVTSPRNSNESLVSAESLYSSSDWQPAWVA